MTRNRLPRTALLIALAAGALCAGACDNDSQSSPTCSKASRQKSRTVWPSPVPIT